MSKYFYTRVPKADSPLVFGRSVDAQLSKCLKTRRDQVILDVSELEEFEGTYVSALTRWLRNVKSVGGTLTLTGVTGNIRAVLDQAKLPGACEVYPDLEGFQQSHPEAEIEFDEFAPVKSPAPTNKVAEVAVAEDDALPEESILEFLDEGAALQSIEGLDMSDKLKFLSPVVPQDLSDVPDSFENFLPLIENKEIPDAPSLHIKTPVLETKDESDPIEGDEEDADDKEVQRLEIGSVVSEAGEYQCLGCGGSDYFLKGYPLTDCAESGCAVSSAGWHLVYKLF